jgi:hypothetical protein
MGWKLPIVMTRAEGRTLQSFVDDAYCASKTLHTSTKPVHDALNPGLFEAFALTHGGFHWIFDWRLSERSFKHPVPVKYPVWVFFLHSVVNGYGFSSQNNGMISRSRLGNGSDDQIVVDLGTPTQTERTLVARFASPGEEAAAWHAWCHTSTSFEGRIEEYTTHDLIGEDVVFGLLEELTGFRMDTDSPEVNRFESALVMQIEKPPGLLARIFGKR